MTTEMCEASSPSQGPSINNVSIFFKVVGKIKTWFIGKQFFDPSHRSEFGKTEVEIAE